MNISIPFPQSYWVQPGLFCAGHYPGSLDPSERDAKLIGLLDCAIRRTINLIPLNEKGQNGQSFDPYDLVLQSLAARRGLPVECLRMDFPDGTAPDISLMRAILDVIDSSIAANEPLYLHCWGGHGRTSTVVGCYLVRHGEAPEQAIEHILTWRQSLPKNWYPFEDGQEALLRSWRKGL